MVARGMRLVQNGGRDTRTASGSARTSVPARQ